MLTSEEGIGLNLETLMRKLVCGMAVALSMMPVGGHAQASLDTTRVTCADYLAMSPEQVHVFSAWISGWFTQKWGYTTVGLDDYARNVASVRQWCTGNPQASVMGALERSIPQPAPPGSQVKVDMSLITCKQYLRSDAERQEMIAYWMSGFFRASRGEPIFDFQRFANNKRTVTNYCKKNGGKTVMSAIQRVAR